MIATTIAIRPERLVAIDDNDKIVAFAERVSVTSDTDLRWKCQTKGLGGPHASATVEDEAAARDWMRRVAVAHLEYTFAEADARRAFDAKVR